MKARAATSGRHDYEILEEALRHYLSAMEAEADRNALRAFLDQPGRPSELSDEEALDMAYAELHAPRRARR